MATETTRIVVVDEDEQAQSINVPAKTGDAGYWSKVILDRVEGVKRVKRGEFEEPVRFDWVGLKGKHCR